MRTHYFLMATFNVEEHGLTVFISDYLCTAVDKHLGFHVIFL